MKKGPSIQRSYSIEVSRYSGCIFLHTVWCVQNGYPGKTRSLVGDAKFEKLVRRESRLSLLGGDTQDRDIPEVPTSANYIVLTIVSNVIKC